MASTKQVHKIFTDDDHSIYALLAGRSGGQTLYGDTASGGSLTLESTSHSTKGNIILNPIDGGVGIGTTSLDQAKLSIYTLSTNAGNNNARFSSPNLGINVSHIHYGLTGDWYIRSASNSGVVYLQDNSSGTVGIGISPPSAKLDVKATIGDILNLRNSATEVFTVLNGGNVGINTSTPGWALEVNGTVTSSGASSNVLSKSFSGVTNSNTQIYVNNNSGKDIDLYVTNLAESGQVRKVHIEGGENTADVIYLTGGKVGINKTNPLASLHVSDRQWIGTPASDDTDISFGVVNDGHFRLQMTSLKHFVEFWKDNTPTKACSFGMSNPGVSGKTDDFIFSLFTGSAWNERLRILNADGSVGIGVSTTGGKLDVKATTGDILNLRNSTSELFTVLNNGSVGIGQAAPDEFLHISVGFLRLDSSSDKANTSILYIDGTGNLNTSKNGTGTLRPLVFSVDDIERMIISTDGNVGIGTTTFGTSAAKVLAIANGTAPTTSVADTVQLYSTDVSPGNTTLGLFTEGTPVTTVNPTSPNRTIAMSVNGTIYYIPAKTTND